MKHFQLLLLLGSIVFSLSSCTKSNVDPTLMASWELKSHDSGTMTLKRVDELPSDKYGFTFLPDGTFIENKNAGWCGTPPITYNRFSGIWSEEEENLINVKVNSWAGIIDIDFLVIELDADELIIEQKFN